MNYEELSQYDTVYFGGGDPQYLLDRINDTNFNTMLKQFVDNGRVYVGLSAGSIVAAQDLPDNLGYVNCTLSVHVSHGSKIGMINTSSCPHIELTNDQAILIDGDKCSVVE